MKLHTKQLRLRMRHCSNGFLFFKKILINFRNIPVQMVISNAFTCNFGKSVRFYFALVGSTLQKIKVQEECI